MDLMSELNLDLVGIPTFKKMNTGGGGIQAARTGSSNRCRSASRRVKDDRSSRIREQSIQKKK